MSNALHIRTNVLIYPQLPDEILVEGHRLPVAGRSAVTAAVRGKEHRTMSIHTPHFELSPSRTSAPERRAGFGLKLAAIIGIGASALTGCASQSVEPAPAPSATASEATPQPSETNATPEQAITTDAFEISGELPPEEAITTLVNDRLSAWTMAGATQETVDGYLDDGGSSEFTKTVAASNALPITDALFVSGWQSNDSLAHYVSFEQQTNAGVLEMWILTGQSGLPQDREPYKRGISVDSVTVSNADETTVTAKVDATEHDNADKNTVGVGERISQDVAIDGNKIAGNITLKKIDDTWKIAAIEWSSRQ